jgi:hypothetical protein
LASVAVFINVVVVRPIGNLLKHQSRHPQLDLCLEISSLGSWIGIFAFLLCEGLRGGRRVEGSLIAGVVVAGVEM